MKTRLLLFVWGILVITTGMTYGQVAEAGDFDILSVHVYHDARIASTVWEMTVSGTAGSTVPDPNGALDGAPVMGYVFPTTLASTDVGFSAVEGIVALALTSHPDFDDTPLWDENADRVYDNDGVVWHPHWVVLQADDRVEGGFSVVQFEQSDARVVLPPTNPGMPMYMDSPGFQVIQDGHTIRTIVPDYRINHQLEFKYDGVSAFMRVNTSDMKLPMLGVYEVYDVAGGELTLPYVVAD